MQIISHKLEDLNNVKYNTLITLKCDCCNKEFQRQRKLVSNHIKRGRKNIFCSHKCADIFHTKKKELSYCLKCNKLLLNYQSKFCSNQCCSISKQKPKQKFIYFKFKKRLMNKKYIIQCISNCSYCKKEILKYKNEIKKSKHGILFCSKTCRMTYYNYNSKKTYGCRRSKAETFLNQLIKQSFPDLLVEENIRTILPSKLEIDIFIPQLKLAIELNGPIHYFPIFGQDRLKKCQNRDILKQEEINKLGLNLIVINISEITSKKKSEKFLTEYFYSIIEPIIRENLVAKGGSLST